MSSNVRNSKTLLNFRNREVLGTSRPPDSGHPGSWRLAFLADDIVLQTSVSQRLRTTMTPARTGLFTADLEGPKKVAEA